VPEPGYDAIFFVIKLTDYFLEFHYFIYIAELV